MTNPNHTGRPYVFALAGLLALTALSFGLHFAPLGGTLGAVAALAIAAMKVTIVALVFMELRDASTPTRTIALVTVGFVTLLCLGIIGDVGFR